MKMLKLSILLGIIISIVSCELLDEVGEELSTAEVVEGLKKALEIGTDTAVSITSQPNGFYADEIIKIALPPEADIIVEYLNKIPTGNQMVEDVLLSVNRAAESAAVKAKPIFKEAITNITIDEAWDILNGTNPAIAGLKSYQSFDSTAATEYFKAKTYNNLVMAFSPEINNALDTDLGLGFSTNQAWNTLTSAFNEYVFPIYKWVDPEVKEVNTDIGEYCTEKALDGLFLKVGDEEKKIRKDPYSWAENIIQKVFGSVL